MFKAYRTRGKDLTSLVSGLKANGVLSSAVVERVMLKVDRGDFAPDKASAYLDEPQPIGYGATISAPHMHVVAMERLEKHVKKGSKVLDVGCGSGYLCACFAEMMEGDGLVVGIDVVDELVQGAVANVRKHHGALLESGVVQIKKGDGWAGDEKNEPFDAIHVGAGAESLPQALVDQLAPGGRMLIPVGPQWYGQEYLQIDKDAKGNVTKQELMSVRYVPLVKGKGGSSKKSKE